MVDPMNDPSMSAASTSATSATTFARCDSRRRSTRGARALSFVRENARALRRSFARHERRDVTRSPFAIRHAHQTRGRPSRARTSRTRDDETTRRRRERRTRGRTAMRMRIRVTNDDGDDSDDARYGAAANTARRTTSRGGRKSPARTQAFHALCTSTGARRLRVRTKTTHMRQPRKVRGRNCSREK